MASGLGDRLRARIRRDGPLPWRDFMDAALYDAGGGFYAAGKHPAGIGTGTHFATSPTLHPFFSACVAREVAEAWRAAGRPTAWEVVEFGAGTGALARDAMAELRRLGVPARWNAIDVRPGPAIKGGRWLDKPPAVYDAVVANEFLDALPFDLFEWRDGTWQMLGVGLEGEHFVWQLLGADDVVADPTARTEEGDRCVSMPSNEPWLASLAKAQVKAAIVIDYGESHPAKDVRAFKGHDFVDPLSEPGSVDLTADVDFAELAEQAQRHGFATKLETQEAFLLRHNVFDVLNKIDRTTREGASAYLRLRQLLIPTGFGAAFKVARLTRRA
ncbi:MAG: SAM-dependent methyltransferase [Candidatus Thermoplasmatota archaeon]